MKTKLAILIVALCGIFVSTSVFGQVTVTWTNNNGGLITDVTNWSPNALPNGNDGSGLQQNAVWDNTTTQDMVITNTVANMPNTGFGTIGINIALLSSHTKNVQFISTVADPGNSGQIGLNFVTNNSPNGQLIFGDFTTTRMRLTARPAGVIHYWENNSTAPVIINPSAEWQAGGGTAYTMEFSGTGNWDVRNSLRSDNGGGGVSVVLDGPGSMVWTNGTTFIPANDAINAVTVNAGTLTMGRNLITSGQSGNGNPVTINGGLLKFQTGSASDANTISRAFNGASPGVFEVNNGIFTMTSSNSTFSGDINLTGNGELIAGNTEYPGDRGPLGLGTISFLGGVLGYNVNNTFDYSARFNAGTGQAYKIDTGGQNVIYTNSVGITGAGNTLTKLGNGTLTLNGGNSTYTGLTTVSLGKLVFQSSKTGTGNITVADGAALGVFTTGAQVTPNTLTIGTSSSATLEFNNVSSTTTEPVAAGSISAGGPIIVNVNNGALVPGNSYPLFSWSSGSAPDVTLGILNGFIGTLSTNGSKIQLNVTATAYKWTGNNNNSWDTTTANNWQQNSGPVVYGVNGVGPAIFDDSASSNTSIVIGSPVQATLVTFNNANTNYSIASSGANNLGGNTPVLQAGSGTTTLSGGANTYTGVTTINNGVLSVGVLANGGSPSDIGASSSSATNLVLSGGTLQYTGTGASIDRLFTLSTSGGTIDDAGSGALVFANTGAIAYSGAGPRTLILSGADTDTNTLAPVLANNGGATSLAKNGAGKWVLTGNNSYSGVTTIANGILQIGAGGSTGGLGSGNVVNNGTLDFNRTGSTTVSGAVSGTGSVIQDGTGTVILANDNTYSGGTTINAGTLQVGNGGGTGKLNSNVGITDNGILIFNSTAPFTISANISGTGQMIKRGSGLLVMRGGGVIYSFSGGMTIDQGAQLQLFQGNEATYTGGPITNNGTLFMVRQDQAVAIVSQNISGNGIVVREANNSNVGDVTFTGTNTYGATNAFSTIIKSGGIVLGDNGVTPFGGSITGNVQFVNSSVSTEPERYISFNRAEDITFSGNIVGAVTNIGTGVGQINPANAGRLIHAGSGILTLTGNNSIPYSTTINFGTLVAGNGGTGGGIGAGPVVNNGSLVLNRSANQTIGDISGVGSLIHQGSGTTTVNGGNASSGSTTVSNGTLIISGIGADLFLEGGTIAPAAAGTVATLTVTNNLTIDSGNILITLNKSLAQSNSLVSVTNDVAAFAGTITATGGSLKVVNAGPAPQVGDKFTVFSAPVTGGNLMTIVSPGLTFANNLATDGSITVTAIQPPPTITATVVGGTQLNLTWPSSWTGGVHLQAQTNPVTKGLSTNWITIAGTDASNTYSTTINKANGSVFYRLITP